MPSCNIVFAGVELKCFNRKNKRNKNGLQINSENHKKKRLNLLFHKNKHLNVPRIIVSVFVRF